MTSATDAVWQVAGELDAVPLEFADLPERSRLWLLAWASAPLTRCEHVGAPLWAVGGYREAMCPACADRAGLDLLVRLCGRCGAPTDGDDSALHAIFALGPHLLAALTMCGACLTNPDARKETR